MQSVTDPTLTALWERTRAMFARAIATVGSTAAIAAITLLSRTTRRDIVHWLAPLEHIVRKLLLAEATELRRAELAAEARGPRIEVVPLTPRRWSGPADVATAKPGWATCAPELVRSCSVDLLRPETWRARFSLSIPCDPACSEQRAPRIRALWGPIPAPSPSPPPRPPRRQRDSAFRLARRFEGLRRVLENPLPYARRLAALLVSIKRRFGEVVRRYLYAPMRADGYDPRDPRLGIEAICHASPALEVFGDSS